MGVAKRDGYSGFAFFQAMSPDVFSAATDGRTIDMRGYDAATIVVFCQSLASASNVASADNLWRFYLQHGLASAAGVSAWSAVPGSQLIHSVYGIKGAGSADSNGVFGSVIYAASATSAITFAVGYRGDTEHRYLRVCFSNTGVLSTMWAAGLAILGRPENWPVNDTP